MRMTEGGLRMFGDRRGRAARAALRLSRLLLAAAASLVVVVSTLLTLHFMQGQVASIPGVRGGYMSDLYPRWVGIHLFWLKGISPYSGMVTDIAQRGFYAPTIRAHGPLPVPEAFDYPLPLVLLLAPLAWMSFPVALASYMVVTMALLLAGAKLVVGATGVPTWLQWLLIGTLVFITPTHQAILLEQPTLLFLALALLGVGCAVRGWWLPAGVALSLACWKPQDAVLLATAIGGWAVLRRPVARPLLFGFVGALALTCGWSLVAMPTWPARFLAQVTAYGGSQPVGTALSALTGNAPVTLVVSGLLLAALGMLVWHARRWEPARAVLAISAAAALVTLLVVPRVALATYDYALVWLPLVFACWVARRHSGRAVWMGVAVMAAAMMWDNLFVFHAPGALWLTDIVLRFDRYATWPTAALAQPAAIWLYTLFPLLFLVAAMPALAAVWRPEAATRSEDASEPPALAA